MPAKIVILNGKEIEFEVVHNYMDEELCEEIHQDMTPCSEQDFTDEYIKRHKIKYNEDFEIN